MCHIMEVSLSPKHKKNLYKFIAFDRFSHLASVCVCGFQLSWIDNRSIFYENKRYNITILHWEL